MSAFWSGEWLGDAGFCWGIVSDYRNLYLCTHGNIKGHPATFSERAEQTSKIMSAIFLFGCILIIYLAYYFGKRDGVIITNKKIIKPGVWRV